MDRKALLFGVLLSQETVMALQPVTINPKVHWLNTVASKLSSATGSTSADLRLIIQAGIKIHLADQSKYESKSPIVRSTPESGNCDDTSICNNQP